MPDPIVGEQQFIPNATTPNYRTRSYRDPSSGQMLLQYTTNGGSTWQSFISQPPSAAAEGSVPSLDVDGTIVWKPINALLTSGSAKVTSNSVNWIDFSFPGTLSSTTKFGYFMVPQGCWFECYGAQAVIFNPSQGRNITVDIFSVDKNANQNKVIRLTEGQIFEETFFNTPLTMEEGTSWQLSTVQIGDNVEGDFLLCRLMLKPL